MHAQVQVASEVAVPGKQLVELNEDFNETELAEVEVHQLGQLLVQEAGTKLFAVEVLGLYVQALEETMPASLCSEYRISKKRD